MVVSNMIIERMRLSMISMKFRLIVIEIITVEIKSRDAIRTTLKLWIL